MGDNIEQEDKFVREMTGVLDRGGIQGLDEYIENDLDKWKTAQINIAVTGSSGAGKSSFINAMRGIDQTHKDAAKEGATETTKDQVPYCHPSNERIKLWDLPGVGTMTMPFESYAGKMGFDKFDFFVIVSSTRFSESDVKLVRKLKDMEKPFYLIRSKIGMDVENQKKSQTREEVLNAVRNECVEILRKLSLDVKRIYILDSHIHTDFELGELQLDLLEDAPSAKKNSLILTFETTTKEVIARKAQYLRKRLYRVALKATVSASLVAKCFFDWDVITDEVSLYRKTFGLDDETLGKSCEMLNVSMAELREIVELGDYIFSQERVIRFCEDTVVNSSSIKKSNMTKFLEYLASVAQNAYRTYHKVYAGLLAILDSLEESALKICENMLDRMRGSTLL